MLGLFSFSFFLYPCFVSVLRFRSRPTFFGVCVCVVDSLIFSHVPKLWRIAWELDSFGLYGDRHWRHAGIWLCEHNSRVTQQLHLNDDIIDAECQRASHHRARRIIIWRRSRVKMFIICAKCVCVCVRVYHKQICEHTPQVTSRLFVRAKNGIKVNNNKNKTEQKQMTRVTMCRNASRKVNLNIPLKY